MPEPVGNAQYFSVKLKIVNKGARTFALIAFANLNLNSFC